MLLEVLNLVLETFLFDWELVYGICQRENMKCGIDSSKSHT